MTQFFLECTIRAALIVAATAIVLYAMRVRVASVKHRVWTAVLLLMLALPLWIAWGPKAPIRILPANVENFTADFLVQTPPTNTAQLQKADTWQTTPAAAEPLRSPLEWSFLGLYFFGAFILLARLAIGTLKARQLIRESSSLELFLAEESLALSIAAPTANKEKSRHPEARPRSDPPKVRRGGKDPSWFSTASHSVTAMCHRDRSIRISSRCAAPVTVGCFRPTILLPENWREWSASHLAAVLAHEREHARRRDPLIQWLALFNRAIFWFHPAAWWLERELSALAEECCDAAVLAQGHDPAAYAETLMHMARAVMHSGSRIDVPGAAMPGRRLPKRVEQIVKGSTVGGLSGARAVILVILVGLATILIGGISIAHATQETPSFEAASIKPSAPGERQAGYMFEPGGHFVAFREPVKDIVTAAYQLRPGQLVAAPKWNSVLAADFDIETRASGNPTIEQMRLMLRSLLRSRFNLISHWEDREMPIFALEAAKHGRTGPRLVPNSNRAGCIDPTRGAPSAMPQPGSPAPNYCGMFSISRTPRGITGAGTRIPMDKLVAWLGGYLDRPLVDDTGLTGSFDVTLTFAPEQPSTSSMPSSASDARGVSADPSIFTALQEQLGLKLAATKGPVATFVIDHIEEPTPN